MSRVVLQNGSAQWDKFREAVVWQGGTVEVAVTLSGLEAVCGYRLDEDEAVEAAIDSRAILTAAANATPPSDGVITLTAGILNSRSWAAHPYDAEAEQAAMEG